MLANVHSRSVRVARACDWGRHIMMDVIPRDRAKSAA